MKLPKALKTPPLHGGGVVIHAPSRGSGGAELLTVAWKRPVLGCPSGLHIGVPPTPSLSGSSCQPSPGPVRKLGVGHQELPGLTAARPQDLIVHVRDVSHPEVELQKRSVLSTLHSLQLPAPLLDSMVEVHNKVDLVPGYSPTEPNAVPVSALLGHGLQELKAELDAAVLKATGRQILTLRVRLAGAQLSWLYKEATVQDVDVIPEDGAADVTVIISDSAYGKFRKLFPG
uniref:Hflx-type G domain-containing protein n=1 Tax=Macaca fascicularis TaxID=9541 RepID=A0A7N9CVU5_MACFA